MQNFLGEAFGETLLLLGKIIGSSIVMEEIGHGAAISVDGDGRKIFLDVTLPQIQDLLAYTGLSVSLAYTDRIKRELLKPVTARQMDALIRQLQERIHDELRSELLLHVPKEKAIFYQSGPLFGAEVQNSFPSASFDIEEAGKCLALARSTACVMHLSRAVEVVLRTLASTLNLPMRNDWGKHIGDIEKELLARYKAAGARTQDEQFYAEAVSQIDHIKTAWRNSTMHVDRVYSEEVAQDIFMAIKSLMRHLATRLTEIDRKA